MKKIIALSLLVLTLGANIPSTVKADGIMNKAGSVVAYPFKKVGDATQRCLKATSNALRSAKEVILAATDLTKGTLVGAAIVVAGVAIVCGVDAALAWATQIGLPATFFNHYTFGVFYNAVYAWMAPIVAAAPEFFKSLPEKITSIPGLVKYLPTKFGAFTIFIASKINDFWVRGACACVSVSNSNNPYLEPITQSSIPDLKVAVASISN